MKREHNSNSISMTGRKALMVLIGLLIALQLAVILASWLYSAANPDSTIRPILSDSGIRWFFGSFVTNLSNPLLVWIILLYIAIGACLRSGLWASVYGHGFSSYRHRPSNIRSGHRAAMALLIVEVIIILLLTLPRHAILLSTMGTLFPSSFTDGLVPIIAFVILTVSIAFGLFSGRLHNYTDVVKCCAFGGDSLKFILAIYILAMELYKMVEYVLSL